MLHKWIVAFKSFFIKVIAIYLLLILMSRFCVVNQKIKTCQVYYISFNIYITIKDKL